MHSEKEMVSNLISLMAHVEGITEESGLIPPIGTAAASGSEFVGSPMHDG